MLNAATPAAGAPRGGAVPVVPLFLSGHRLSPSYRENREQHAQLPPRSEQSSSWMRQGMGRGAE